MKHLTIDSKNITYRLNKIHGYMEVVDMLSGQVLAVQKDYNENFILGKMDELIEATIDGKVVLIQKGISIDKYKLPVLSYSKPLADLIIQGIQEGETMRQVTKKLGIQRSTINTWMDKVPEFGEALERARRLSADDRHDELMEMADKMKDASLPKGELETISKRAEILKWSAEKSDANRYGNRNEKAASGAVQIIIQTGISREEAPLTVEVKDEREATSKSE